VQKLAIIALLFLMAGCSVARKATGKTEIVSDRRTISSAEIREFNLTKGDFTVVKAHAGIKSGRESQRMILNMRFKSPGTYLLSVRTPAGIEAARVFISGDTILVNDRINKILYYGSDYYLKDKYGISTAFLPVLLGDYVAAGGESKRNNCHNKVSEITENFNTTRLKYTIDCDRKKVKIVSSFENISKRGVSIEFDKFENTGDISYAKRIKMSDEENQTEIEINIDKLERGPQGEINFIPGKNYRMVKLQ